MTTPITTPPRNRGGVVMLVLTAILAIVLLGDALIRAGIGQTLLLAPWVLLVVWAVHVVGVASSIRLRDDGVFVQNLLRRTLVPWARVTQVAMRWQIEITMDDGRVLTCFGGPARSRPQRLGPGRTREDANGTADDLVAAMRKAKGAAGAASDAPVRRSWDVRALIALFVLVVWAVVAIVIAYA